MAGKVYYDRKKKRYSRLSGGCAIIITTKKKGYSCLSVGCAVLTITTGKKRYSRLSGGLCCCVRKDTVVCLASCAVVSVFGSGGKWAVFVVVGGKFYFDRKKKDTVVCLAGARS